MLWGKIILCFIKNTGKYLNKETHFIVFLLLMIPITHSCWDNQSKYKSLNQKIFVSIDTIAFLASTKLIIDNSDTIKWYYPYQMVIELGVQNNSNDTVFLINNDDILQFNPNIFSNFLMSSQDGTYKLFLSPTHYRILPKSNEEIVCYSIDMPFFKSVFTKNQMNTYLKELKNDYIFSCNNLSNTDNITDTELKTKSHQKDIVKFVFSRKFNFKVTYGQSYLLRTSDLGYPFDTVPKDLFIFPPSLGLEY